MGYIVDRCYIEFRDNIPVKRNQKDKQMEMTLDTRSRKRLVGTM